jgi:hypothetical protein
MAGNSPIYQPRRKDQTAATYIIAFQAGHSSRKGGVGGLSSSSCLSALRPNSLFRSVNCWRKFTGVTAGLHRYRPVRERPAIAPAVDHLNANPLRFTQFQSFGAAEPRCQLGSRENQRLGLRHTRGEDRSNVGFPYFCSVRLPVCHRPNFSRSAMRPNIRRSAQHFRFPKAYTHLHHPESLMTVTREPLDLLKEELPILSHQPNA